MTTPHRGTHDPPEGRDPRGEGRAALVGAALAVCLWMVRLYPPEFRRRFGEDLEQDFRAMASAPGRPPLRVAVRLLGRAGMDVVGALPREWLRYGRLRSRGMDGKRGGVMWG